METPIPAPSPEDFQLLQDELTSTSKARDRAQLTMLAIQLGLCVFFVIGMWNAFSGFLDRGIGPTTNVLARYLERSSGRYLTQVNETARRVVPKLTAALSQEIDQRLPHLEQQAEAEKIRLAHLFHKQWPKMENEFAILVDEQTKIVEQEFGVKVTPERAKAIAAAYRTALPNKAVAMGERLFGKHADALAKLRVTASKLSKKEADLINPSDPVEALGLSLELAGLEVQEQVAEVTN